MTRNRLDPDALDGLPRNRDGSRRRPISEAGKARLQRIKDVAARVFYERGFHAADLRDIAAEVGMHQSTFYHYVESKQQILYLIVRDGLDTASASFERSVLPLLDDPVRALQLALELHVSRASQRPYVSWSNFSDLSHFEGDFRSDIAIRRKRYTDLWVALFRRGVEARTFPDIDPTLAAFGVMAMAQNVGQWYSPAGALSPAEIAALFSRIVIGGLHPATYTDPTA